MDKKDFQLSQANTLLGWQWNFPLHQSIDPQKNTYLCLDTYSSFLKYKDDTLFIPNGGAGNGFIFKFDSRGDIDWYHRTSSYFRQSFINDIGECYVMGSFINNLEVDDIQLAQSPDAELGYLIHFNENGEYKDVIFYEGTGVRIFTGMEKGRNKELILLGEFREEIHASGQSFAQCKGANDAFIFFADFQGKVHQSFYFQGDSTEHIEDIVELENGNFLLVGYTLSDTLVCGRDTLITGDHQKNYFLYEISKDLLSEIQDNNPQKLNINIYPSPAKDFICIEIENSVISNPAGIRILNQNGKYVLAKEIIIVGQSKIDISFLLPGIYFVVIVDSNGLSKSWKVFKS